MISSCATTQCALYTNLGNTVLQAMSKLFRQNYSMQPLDNVQTSVKKKKKKRRGGGGNLTKQTKKAFNPFCSNLYVSI